MIKTQQQQGYRSPRLRPTPAPTVSRAARWASWLLPVVTLLLVAALSNFSQGAYDLWWQLKSGELIWAHHSVPTRDVFSHTAAGRPWHVQEWLTEVFFFALYRDCSANALVAFKLIGCMLIFAVVIWRCWLRCRMIGLAVAVSAVAAYAARPFFDIRPQLFSYLFFSLALLCLDQWRAGAWRRSVWLLPVITLVWVNFHGAFMVMFALIGVELVAEVWNAVTESGPSRRLITLTAVGALCGLAGLANPGGMEAYRYAFLLLGNSEMLNSIKEWASPNFHESFERPLGYLILLFTFACVAARRGRARDLLLMVGLLHGAMFSKRHVPLLALAAAPIAAELLGESLHRIQEWMTSRQWPCERWRVATLVGLGLLLTGRFVVHAQETQLPGLVAAIASGTRDTSWFSATTAEDIFPIRACNFLLSQPGSGRLYNTNAWGGYCLWRLWPKYRVFVDNRAEVFFGTTYSEYLPIKDAEPGWEERLRHWEVDTVLVDAGCMLAKVLLERPNWRRIYVDEQAVVYQRVDARQGALAE